MASARTRYVESCVAALSLTGSTRTADEVEACAKAVEAEECGVVPVLLASCAPKAGTLPAGSACNVDAQCQSGLCDLLDLRAKAKGCGVCMEPTPERTTCDRSHPTCAPPTFCSTTATSPLVGYCLRRRYVDEGASCDGIESYCHPGFVCASIDGSPHTCIRQHSVGEQCPGEDACEKGTFCSTTGNTCASRGNVGEPCDSITPCNEGLGCDRTTNKCAPLTFAEPGESCGGSVACREGVCGQGTGAPTCPDIVQDGKACLEGANMTCQAPATCIAGACLMAITATCQ